MNEAYVNFQIAYGFRCSHIDVDRKRFPQIYYRHSDKLLRPSFVTRILYGFNFVRSYTEVVASFEFLLIFSASILRSRSA